MVVYTPDDTVTEHREGDMPPLFTHTTSTQPNI